MEHIFWSRHTTYFSELFNKKTAFARENVSQGNMQQQLKHVPYIVPADIFAKGSRVWRLTH
jgi:ATP-dependent Zn protease